jgi:predicted aspartyl protease
MMDGTHRIEFHDVAILAMNERVVLCRVHDKVVRIDHRRMLPGTVISERGDYSTLVVTRDVAENLGLIFP